MNEKNMDKYGIAREATDNNIIWRIRIPCWIAKATGTHSEYVIITAILHNNGCTRALQCYNSNYIARIVNNIDGT